MVQLASAISLISTERSVKDTCLHTGQRVEVLVGNKRFSGIIATLDLKVSNIQYRPLNVDIDLSLTDVVQSSQGDLL